MRITAIVTACILLVTAGAFFVFLPRWSVAVSLDAFAQCLSERGVVMYGADWCPHCQNEKKAFGDSFRLVSYVECPDDPKRCLAAGIAGYPTWIFPASPARSAGATARRAGGPDGKKLEGEQGLRKLSRESGCVLPNSK